MNLTAPFPYPGGKRHVIDEVWRRFGALKQYLEPFCGSAAIMLGAPRKPLLEVIGDQNLYVVNFWRAVKLQPEAVAEWQDYPVTHLDLAARHRWLVEPERLQGLRDALEDPDWPGDAKIAGWWVWGCCAWIGSGWCDTSKVPHVGNRGRGLQVPSQVPHVGNRGVGLQAPSAPRAWIDRLAERLRDVRVLHGDWTRCLSTHYGENCNGVIGVFLDPPYRDFESLYGTGTEPVADAVAKWAQENARPRVRIALCGHRGDYDLPGWDVYEWTRLRPGVAGSTKTRDAEAIWFSPGCVNPQASLFDGVGGV